MKTEDIKILEIGLGLSDEIDITEILEGDTTNNSFMCGCTIDGGCNGFGLVIKIPL